MRPIDMAEFVGEEPISVGVDEPITFENKTDTAFDVGCGIVFRKSGLYRVSIVGGHMSVAVEPERENETVGCNGCRYDWFGDPRCSRCARSFQDYYEADMIGEQDEQKT